MNPNEVLRIVDAFHREKNIDPEIVFQAIEAALATAARRQHGEESEIEVHINREDGSLTGYVNGEPVETEEIGRIGAQTAKQVIIQKIREAERDSLLEEYQDQVGQLVNGTVQRAEGRVTTVALGTVEAILPRSEQIPGESHHANERVRAVVLEVRPQGTKVQVVLSRTHQNFVRRLFEQEIPEIADGVITVNAIAREPGYRSKVAVSSTDERVDCVGACVGVRGNRIKNIVDELAGERIDIVRWNDDPEDLIPNALQPAEVDQVLLCDMIGRAIVLVREDQLSLAIGRRGQNVRLASKLCGWDIEIMTSDELGEQIDQAVAGFSALEGVNEELAQALVEQGYLSYDDLSVIEPDALMEMGGLTEEQVDLIVEQAEARAEEAERAAEEEKRRQREQRRLEEAQAAAREAAEAAARARGEEPAAEAEEPAEPVEGAANTPTPPTEGETEAAASSAETPPGEVVVPAEEAGEAGAAAAEMADRHGTGQGDHFSAVGGETQAAALEPTPPAPEDETHSPPPSEEAQAEAAAEAAGEGASADGETPESGRVETAEEEEAAERDR